MSAKPDASESHENLVRERVRAEQVQLIYQQARPAMFISVLVSGVVCWVLWDVTDRRLLTGWFAIIVVLALLRAVLVFRFTKRNADSDVSRWERRFVVSLALTGLVWGIGGWMIMPTDSLAHQAVVYFFLIGMVSGAVASYAAHALCTYLTISSILLPSTIWFVLQDDIALRAMAFGGALYVAAAYRATKVLAFFLRRSFQLSEEAERANVAKSKFLAAASHDLRQPLHALSLFVTALDERIHYPEVRRIVDNISKSVSALEKLFTGLLDISRLDAGVVHPKVADFRLHELLERLRNEFEPEAQQKGLDFHIDASDLVVRSDPQLLERILRNFLSNALRYTIRGKVSLRCRVVGGDACIEVADTGKGIPPDKQQEIFGEFYQLENPERDRTKGLGLGLAIVERLSQLLKHPISLNSEPGRGSAFQVSVPLGDVTALARERTAVAPAVANDIAGMLVLVIDDEPSVREGMQTLLSQWGCELLLAASEEEAIELLHDGGRVPDVVIADYRLREGRTGAEAIRRVQAQAGIDMPALIITGDTAPDRLREASASGLQLLHKPVPPAQLRAFLRNARKARVRSAEV